MTGRGDIAVVLGTRPEAIKLAQVIELLGPRAWVLHTGQHYDASLARNVDDDLGVRPPHVQLAVGGLGRGEQIGLATDALSRAFADRPPRCVVVQGDTNSALAGGLAANAAGIPLVHVEAGLRSRDRAMPEEHNRVLIDHLADLCAAPTALAADHLRSEGIAEDCIRITGNTGVEAVERLLPAPDDQLRIVDSYGAAPGAYVLATIHRPENTDDAQRLRPILEGLAGLASKVLLPLHPRTHAAADRHGLGGLLDAVCVVPPLPPTSFLALLRQARLVVSDSGGIQEEVAAVGRYVLVVRRSTERPEALGVFSELVAPDDVGGRAEGLLATDLDRSGHPNPFGDGTASAQISEAVLALAG